MAHHGPRLPPNGVMFRRDGAAQSLGQQCTAAVLNGDFFDHFKVLLPGPRLEGQWRGPDILSESFQSSGYRKLGKAGLKRDLSKIWSLNGILQSLDHAPLGT